MASPVDGTAAPGIDPRGVDRLRLEARRDPDAALRAAAKQFEALFLQMVLKSMREATPADGPFDSEETRFYNGMLDQQIAQSLASRGIGLADAMIRQLERTRVAPHASVAAPPGGAAPAAGDAEAARKGTAEAREFIGRFAGEAARASEATGVPAAFILGQAALESGWGRREIRAADGTPSHNLFGVKAGRGWNGPVAQAATTEYVNGVAQRTTEKFRAYGSYAEAFADYARLLASSSRYAGVVARGLDAAGFARALQQAGYATDPAYADKLTRILNGPALKQAHLG